MSWLHLLNCWWSGDRIRVSPREGRLLRLHSGNLVRISGRTFEVVNRRIQAGNGPQVQYDCRGYEGNGELIVDQHHEVIWRFAGNSFSLHSDEVEVYQ